MFEVIYWWVFLIYTLVSCTLIVRELHIGVISTPADVMLLIVSVFMTICSGYYVVDMFHVVGGWVK